MSGIHRNNTGKRKGDIIMKKRCNAKRLAWTLLAVLFAAMALATAGCNGKSSADSPSPSQVDQEGNILGEGETQFTFDVVDQEGNETQFEIHTDKETVGEALLELGLIAGEEGDYGLYVKTVNGITADYDEDGVYWAFYIDGEYATTGVDATPVKEGETYSFKVEKQ